MNPSQHEANPTPAGHEAGAAPSASATAIASGSPAAPAPAGETKAAATGMTGRKKAILGGVGIVVLALLAYFGIPWVLLSLNTVSTDDAYVNSHVTFVAARVAGQVELVKVDDNKRVKAGDLIVQLDPKPYQVQVAWKEAILETAKSDLVVASALVQGEVAQARNSRFKLENAMNNLNAQVDKLRGSVFALNGELAVRDDARKVYERYKELMKTVGATTPQELDTKEKDYLVAVSKVEQSLEGIYQIRTGLGLTSQRVKPIEINRAPLNLAETPKDLDQTAPAIRQAVAELMQAAAPLGVNTSSFDLHPTEVLDEFLKRDPEPQADPKGKLDRIYRMIIKSAPAIVQAKAKVDQAQRDLDQANLNLSYCDVRAEIDGVVTRRNVNRGNNVQAGQALMAIRSLKEIWIDANFKETQLTDLLIGQRVKVEVDMYGSRREYEGRITGFTMGTGQTLALLPPQNATGNFVKIVQRLPVKVELNEYDPDKAPLFVGLSVTPYVYFREPLIGKDPGKGNKLQPLEALGGKQ